MKYFDFWIFMVNITLIPGALIISGNIDESIWCGRFLWVLGCISAYIAGNCYRKLISKIEDLEEQIKTKEKDNANGTL